MNRTSRLAALALAGALTLTACGGEDTKDQKSSDKQTPSTSNTTSASPSPSASPSTPAVTAKPGQPVDLDAFLSRLGAGAEAVESAHVVMTMTSAGLVIKGEGDALYQGKDSRIAMDVQIAGQAMKMILIGSDVYVQAPALTGSQKWIKGDINDPNGPLGDLSDITDSFDPGAMIEQYRAGYTKVVLVGEEKVDGVSTRHFRLTVDPSKVEDLAKVPGAEDLKPFDMDLWVDEDDVVRKAVVDLELGGQASRVEVANSKVNEKVTINPPPASEVQ